jgi:hypothetical protein
MDTQERRLETEEKPSAALAVPNGNDATSSAEGEQAPASANGRPPSPQEFYREFADHPDGREILRRLAQ